MTTENVGDPVPVPLGNFMEGEIPDPIKYEFLNADDTSKDLSSASVDFHIERTSSTGTVTYIGGGATTIVGNGETPEVESIAQYQFEAADMTAGHYQGVFWVTKGAFTYASKRIIWYSEASIFYTP